MEHFLDRRAAIEHDIKEIQYQLVLFVKSLTDMNERLDNRHHE